MVRRTSPLAGRPSTLLTDAIHAAAARVCGLRSRPPAPTRPATCAGVPSSTSARSAPSDDGEELTEQAVAAYVAKYATKAAETTGTVDRRIGNREALELLDLPDHTRRLIAACFDLDAHYPDRKLRALGPHARLPRPLLHQVPPLLHHPRRAAPGPRRLPGPPGTPQRGLPDPDDTLEGSTLVLAHWTYAGHGHTPGESWLAASIARDIRTNRDTAREALADLPDDNAGEW